MHLLRLSSAFLVHRCLCLAGLALLCHGTSSCSRGVDREALIPPEGKYDVTIHRDNWGVPHIYGKRDVDTAYGLAYAHCEDDFATIQQTLWLARGQLASVEGKEAAPFDYLVKLFRFGEIVEREYEKQLSPDVRALCEAYADGFNHYAALHPELAGSAFLPATGMDIVAGFVTKTPLFFGLDGEMQRLFAPKRKREVSEKYAANPFNPLTNGLPVGSNTFSIAPGRTPDGKTHLAVNSHQPWTGPVAWYEAHLKSEEGWDMVGGVFPGCPLILHGHNRNLGWAHTVNSPDLVDIYVLEMNPENPNQYLFDGAWRDLETAELGITVRLWGGFKWTVKREALYSVHGPVVRQDHGVYAIRYAGYGDIRQVEQWYRMNKASNIEEFEAAMRIQGIPSFNVGYADREGNIWYIYNALAPLRAEGYNWKQYLPGNTSETLWSEYLPFDRLPQVKNPASGFVQNANSTPYRTTLGPGSPDPDAYSPTLGFQPYEDMKNRSLRLIELLGSDESITEEEFYAYKFDTNFSEESEVAGVRKLLLAAGPPEDPLAREALGLLRAWDLSTNPENTSAGIGVLSIEAIVREGVKREEAPMFGKLREKAQLLMDTFGRLDVPWNEVNRLVRGDLNLGIGGGPDILHAVYGKWNKDHIEGQAGDCYVLMVTWDPDGAVHSRSIHQFGSATLDASSPHYADQAPLFVKREMKPVLLEWEALAGHLHASYRPSQHWVCPGR